MNSELDDARLAYQNAVEEWIKAIRLEESLAAQTRSLEEVDRWEAAHFEEERLRDVAIEAKRRYEDAIRKDFFGF